MAESDPAQVSSAHQRRRRRIWPFATGIVAGAVGIWFAETYKPSLSNQLGLNDNSFYLRPTTDHVVLIAAIVIAVLGVVGLLAALTDR